VRIPGTHASYCFCKNEWTRRGVLLKIICCKGRCEISCSHSIVNRWVNLLDSYWHSRVHVVVIAKCYGLDDPGFKSRWGLDFLDASSRSRNPPGFLYNGNRVSMSGIIGWAVAITIHPLQAPTLNMGAFPEYEFGMLQDRL
jgi:hypothetical protein